MQRAITFIAALRRLGSPVSDGYEILDLRHYLSGTEYRYTVKASNACAEAPASAEVVATTSGHPPDVATPTNLHGRQRNGFDRGVVMDRCCPGVAGYDVYRWNGSAAPVIVNNRLIGETN